MKTFPLALVTGAANRLGKTLALTLARHGFAIFLHYYSSVDEASASAEEIRAIGVPVYLAQADLTKDPNLPALISAHDAIPHQLCVLVNSASIMLPNDSGVTPTADWDATFALNLRAPFLLSQQAAGIMAEGGLIVNITDVGAHKLWSRFPAYVISKSALETLTRLLAKSYAPRIRVNAIAPGLVLPSKHVTQAEWKKLIQRLPLKRPTTADEVAKALKFLLDNKSVTGQTIVVDGGYSLI
jgi:NAD(P)-dependent dehydrogenase (short-subunit alcohol dehydrogenase family)